MSTAAIAIVVVGAVLLAVVAAFWDLLRRGGGLQLKTAPVPTEKQIQRAIEAKQAAGQPAPVKDLAAKRDGVAA